MQPYGCVLRRQTVGCAMSVVQQQLGAYSIRSLQCSNTSAATCTCMHVVRPSLDAVVLRAYVHAAALLSQENRKKRSAAVPTGSPSSEVGNSQAGGAAPYLGPTLVSFGLHYRVARNRPPSPPRVHIRPGRNARRSGAPRPRTRRAARRSTWRLRGGAGSGPTADD